MIDAFFFKILQWIINLAILVWILRWLLGISALDKRVKALESAVEALRHPGPAPALSPQEMTVAAGDPPMTLTNVPRELSLLTLDNGRPGLSRLAVTVNGVSYELPELANGEERTLALSDSMQPDDRNVLTFEGEGSRGASARVTLTTF